MPQTKLPDDTRLRASLDGLVGIEVLYPPGETEKGCHLVG